MQSDVGKLFIGGISWDTNEESLRGYFSRYGEVLESMIMKDRATGRARGFGFVVFADPAVADRVIKEKHNINGRIVEAKKAVPRDDNTKIGTSIKSSPNHRQTRKIFVGGLASTVTENDLKMYFNRFGTIIDAVVMYDQNTKRPRGFGFVTYNSENAVNNVLSKSFHQLNGKMVEVKRAVPKELSATVGPNPYGFNRINSILNGPYSPSTIGDFDRFGPMGLNFEAMTSGINYNNTRGLSPYYVGNSSRFGSHMSGNGSNISFFSSNPGTLWGNGGLDSIGSGNGVIGRGLMLSRDGDDLGYGLGRNVTSGRDYDAPFSDFYASGGSIDLTLGSGREGYEGGSDGQTKNLWL